MYICVFNLLQIVHDYVIAVLYPQGRKCGNMLLDEEINITRIYEHTLTGSPAYIFTGHSFNSVLRVHAHDVCRLR